MSSYDVHCGMGYIQNKELERLLGVNSLANQSTTAVVNCVHNKFNDLMKDKEMAGRLTKETVSIEESLFTEVNRLKQENLLLRNTNFNLTKQEKKLKAEQKSLEKQHEQTESQSVQKLDYRKSLQSELRELKNTLSLVSSQAGAGKRDLSLTKTKDPQREQTRSTKKTIKSKIELMNSKISVGGETEEDKTEVERVGQFIKPAQIMNDKNSKKMIDLFSARLK